MWHSTNFDLFPPEHSGQVTLARDFDTDEDVSSFLEDDAGLLNINFKPYGVPIPDGNGGFGVSANTPHVGNYRESTHYFFSFVVNFSNVKKNIGCVYLEKLNIKGCEMQVLVETESQPGVPQPITGPPLRSVANAVQKEDFLFTEVPYSVLESKYYIYVFFPKSSIGTTSNFDVSMGAPFIGGKNITSDVGAAYSWGRAHGLLDNVSFEKSQSQSFGSHERVTSQKTFSIQHLSSDQYYKFADFLLAYQNRVTLMVERVRKSRHNFVLGKTVGGSDSVQAAGDLNSIQLKCTGKYSL